MNNIKIGSKLIASFLFIAAMTAFVGIFLIGSLRTIDGQAGLLYEKGAVPLGMLVQTAEKAQEMRIYVREWRLAKTDEDRAAALKAFDETYAVLKDVIAGQKELVLVENAKKFLDDLQDALNNYKEEVNNYASAAAERRPLSGLTVEDFTPSLLNAEAEILKAGGIAIEMTINTVERVSKDTAKHASRAENVAIVVLIIILIVSVSAGVLLTISITRPLGVVVNELSKIETGDMTARVGLKRGDELGVLSKALDSLSTKLQAIFRNLRQHSDTLASSAEELSGVGRQIAAMAEENLSQSTTVASATEQTSVSISAMASTAEEASVNANEVAGAAEQMSTNMNTIAAEIKGMSESISQISNNAGDARNVANEAAVKSREATDVMNKLGTAAREIGHVTDVIKKIADKTNLLALNATIEAASAGEAGKGFAVVAGEIKELANQSAQSADDIARRIEGIQAGTGDAVKAINDVSVIIEKINHSVEAISNHVSQQTKASNEISNNVEQANTGAKRVASAIGEVAKGSGDIARNAGEAAKGSNVVSNNMAGIARGANDGAQGANQINQGAQELAKIAGDLKNALDQFRI